MTTYIDKTKEQKEEKKKTEFVYFIDNVKIDEPDFKPEEFDYVELVRRKDDYYTYDLLVAYDKENKGKDEYWYLGHAGGEFE